jgi:toxin-antitoxin system PIN domain toxin
MLAVDANILVYAHRREVEEHEVAARVVRELATGDAPWGVPWPCIYEFFSVVTNARIWRDAASTPAQATAQLDAWTGSPTLRLLGEPEGFLGVLRPFLARARVRGPVVHDARVAAICIAHGVRALLSRDRDFSLFPELRVENPFA